MDFETAEKKLMQVSNLVFSAIICIALCGWIGIITAGWLHSTYLKYFGH